MHCGGAAQVCEQFVELCRGVVHSGGHQHPREPAHQALQGRGGVVPLGGRQQHVVGLGGLREAQLVRVEVRGRGGLVGGEGGGLTAGHPVLLVVFLGQEGQGLVACGAATGGRDLVREIAPKSLAGGRGNGSGA